MPQKAVLSPKLYNITSDLPINITNKKILNYADERAIIIHSMNLNSKEHYIQRTTDDTHQKLT